MRASPVYVLRVAPLRVGAGVCVPQFCLCGERIYSRGLHGLFCEHSAGRFPMHSAMNDVIKRSLYKASLSSVLEHSELDRRDGSRPDCITVLPFICGSLVWNYTCVVMFAGVHLNRSAMEACTAANYAEEHKSVNTLLLQRHISLSQLQSKRWDCMGGPLESS